MNRRATLCCLSLLMLLSGAYTLPAQSSSSAFKGQAIPSAQNGLPSFADAVSSRKDLWGEAAMAQPNGPSYEFFEKLLPPPRYVNADFRFYPIVLSAPNTRTKARLISNGSGVNVRGGTRAWHDTGTAAIFRVGPDELRFGEFLERLEHP